MSTRQLTFENRLWTVKQEDLHGPGPNRFDERNVTALPDGGLKLDVVRRDRRWTCAELRTVERLGLGTYQIWLIGRIDQLDPQLVFGFFPHPTPDVGPSRTHEIDIEFARWGASEKPLGNFTVWPTRRGRSETTRPFPVVLQGDYTTHRIVRRVDSVVFSSHHGHLELADPSGLIARWEYKGDVSAEPMPLHLNLYLFRGRPPQDGAAASVIVGALRFVPATLS